MLKFICMDRNYWNQRYLDKLTGWDIGYPSTPLKEYFDQLSIPKDAKILIPGCGNAYEAEYLKELGFINVYLLDISEIVLEGFAEKYPDYNREHLICDDFFNHEGKYDLIIEQTFFCALDPSLRDKYAEKMSTLLKDDGKLVGLFFGREFEGGPPFGGTKEEYVNTFNKYFDIKLMEDSFNSIEPRQGSELFFIMKLKP